MVANRGRFRQAARMDVQNDRQVSLAAVADLSRHAYREMCEAVENDAWELAADIAAVVTACNLIRLAGTPARAAWIDPDPVAAESEQERYDRERDPR